jgi:hypothetical protein
MHPYLKDCPHEISALYGCTGMHETHPYVSDVGQDWKVYRHNKTLHPLSWSRPTRNVLLFAILQLCEVVVVKCRDLLAGRAGELSVISDLYRSVSSSGTSRVTISMLRPNGWIGGSENLTVSLLKMLLLSASLSVTEVDSQTSASSQKDEE